MTDSNAMEVDNANQDNANQDNANQNNNNAVNNNNNDTTTNNNPNNNNNNEQSQAQDFRKVHESTVKQIKGRSIVQILYDRSIHGRKGVGGIRRNQSFYASNHHYNQFRKVVDPSQQDHRSSLFSHSSPSSVIPSAASDEDNDDDSDIDDDNHDMEGGNDDGNQTNMQVDPHTNSHAHADDMDSLSDVLRDSESVSDDQQTPQQIRSHKSRSSDSLSEILNNSNNHNNSIRTTNSIQSQQPSKLPPRLKMNSYPCNHFTEIRNYAESYSVTKFDWSYLSLASREEIAQHRNYVRRTNSNNSNSNNSNSNSTNNNDNTNQNNNHERFINDTAISTISTAFSPDGRTLASTHGDHTVKITCCHTGALIRNLEGHPRTPWTVKYHPTKSNIVASGCLGYLVRIWDWNQRSSSSSRRRRNRHDLHEGEEEEEEDNPLDYHLGKGVCLNQIRLQSSIISLSFHPIGSLLAIASGHSLHLWVYESEERDNRRNQNENTNRNGGSDGDVAERRQIENGSGGGGRNTNQNDPRAAATNHRNRSNNANERNSNNNSNSVPSSIITQVRYDHNLRCVYFPPGGDTIILGGVNPQQYPGDTSYSLRLWDFDLEVALNPQRYLGEEGRCIATDVNGERKATRDALKNFKTFLPRALLYGDGGFDVSPDGTKLCGCAEYWLPDGVDSAMELIERKEELAWMEEENARLSAVLDNESSSDRPLVRSPRRKMKRQQQGKEEKRRKETTGAVVATESDDTNLATTEGSGPRITEGCRTPPNPVRPQVLTSPPLPPGRRWSLQFNRSSNLNRTSQQNGQSQNTRGTNNMPMPLSSNIQDSSRNQPRQGNSDGPPPPPLPPSHNPNHRPGMRTGGPFGSETSGRYVPHVVVVNLDKSGNLGRLLEATPIGSRASSVTCVKFSPSTEFCLLGYGVREHAPQPLSQRFHPVTALYNVKGGISHVATMLSSDDDVNIAMFHPNHGQGFVYGTKQGRVKVVSPRPWNHYYE